MPRPIARDSRQYLEFKFSQGYSPSAVREAHNHLASNRTREPFPQEQRLYGHRRLSEPAVLRAYDRWRVYGRRHPESKEAVQVQERRTRNQERLATYRLKAEQRQSLGLPLPPSPLQAADAGMVYRVTHDSHWREYFEEGSP
ncbi:MAG: hypothetical protein L3K05_00030 [Thermoplasmata archaeon]|nr:hypothetical protein [Thermoplasmata archaeon]